MFSFGFSFNGEDLYRATEANFKNQQKRVKTS